MKHSSSPRPFRIVVFTAEPPTRSTLRLVRMLHRTRGIEVGAVFVDRRRPDPIRRARFLLGKWGVAVFASSLVWQIGAAAARRGRALAERLWLDRFLRPAPQPDWSELAASGPPVVRVPDINAGEAAERASEMDADLGVIVGGRILSRRLIDAPRLGSLNIHKHDARKYRGGAQIGYPERLAGDDRLGITVHFATSRVDAGDIVALAEIPIERFDTADSLEIKADSAGARLYLDAIRAVAAGKAKAVPQESASARLDATSPYLPRWLLWRKVERQRRRASRPPGQSVIRSMRIAAFRRARAALTVAALPWLARIRRRLERTGQAPIVILYYHGVGNGAQNWMTLPLEEFDRQVRFLRDRFKIVSLEEALRRLRSGRNDEVCAVLTFDDGYRTLSDVLRPYLEWQDIPATCFVCAEAIRVGVQLPHDRNAGCSEARLLNVNQLRRLASAAEIGSHGNHHEDMATLSGEPLATAIAGSGQALSGMIGVPIRYFSFPFGNKRNISAEALRVAASAYDAAFSAYGGYNLPDGSERKHFQRIANPTDLGSLRAIMAGLHRLKPYYQDCD